MRKRAQQNVGLNSRSINAQDSNQQQKKQLGYNKTLQKQKGEEKVFQKRQKAKENQNIGCKDE